MRQVWAKQGVGAHGYGASGRGGACRSGVEGMRGGAEAMGFSCLWERLEGQAGCTAQAGEETEWRWVEAREAQRQGFRERETSAVNT